MAAISQDRKALFGRLFNYANNGITIAGIVLTTLSALLIVTFIIVELSGGLRNDPYIGLFAYVALPVVFMIGLVEIPIGMWRRRRKLIREGASEKELSDYPTSSNRYPGPFSDDGQRRDIGIHLIPGSRKDGECRVLW